MRNSGKKSVTLHDVHAEEIVFVVVFE